MALFDGSYDTQLAWTADRMKAMQALTEITKRKAGTRTRLYEALERTLRREFRNMEGRRVVIVLTDGQDTEYSHKHNSELRKALQGWANSEVARSTVLRSYPT